MWRFEIGGIGIICTSVNAMEDIIARLYMSSMYCRKSSMQQSV